MHAQLDDIWPRFQAQLQRAVGDSAYSIWLQSLQPVRLDDSALVLAVKREQRAWVEDRFRRVLQSCAGSVLGPEVSVELVELGSEDPTPSTAGGGGGPQYERREAGREVGLNPKYTFDQFVVGESNRLAHASALTVAELPGHAYNPLFICGPPGVGKTHLLHSIAAYVKVFGSGLTVRATTLERFTDGFVDALRSGGLEAFKAAHRTADVLLIDDVQFVERKAKTEEELLHTFNALYETGAQLVLTSDRMPRDLGRIEDRLRERFESGLVADVRPPDFSVRMTILRKRVATDGIGPISDEALEVIADRITANVRALEGALIRVVAFHSLTGRAIDAGLATEVLDSLLGPSAAPQRSVREIQDAICKQFGVTRDDLLSSSRVTRVTWPRQIGMYLARELTDQTLPTIGRQFGGRNHATVLHAWRRTVERMKDDREASAAVHDLLSTLGHDGADRRH